jgi:hypothetical protein
VAAGKGDGAKASSASTRPRASAIDIFRGATAATRPSDAKTSGNGAGRTIRCEGGSVESIVHLCRRSAPVVKPQRLFEPPARLSGHPFRARVC